MKQKTFPFTLILVLIPFLISCVMLANPTSTPTPTSTPPDTVTPTIEPTTPALFANTCLPLNTLQEIRNLIPYEQYEILFNAIQGHTILSLWFVDPKIAVPASIDEISANLSQAEYDAAALAIRLVTTNDCLKQSFDLINPIVVDAEYNGWLSITIPTATLTPKAQPSVGDLNDVRQTFSQSGYRRELATSLLSAPPENSCNWAKADSNLWEQFDPSRPNVGFFLERDETGVNVWAQWDGDTNWNDKIALPMVIASTLNVTVGIECLYPNPTNIYVIVVDENGNIGLTGILPQQGIENRDISTFQYQLVK